MRLQEIVDELAESLGRSVVVGDLEFRPLAASAQEDDIDVVRSTALLKREAPPAVRAHLESLGLARCRQAQRVDLTPYGGRERLVVPVVDGGEVVALLWLVTGDQPPLTAADLEAVEAARALVGRVVAEDGVVSRRRERRAELRRLLSRDETEGSEAFRAVLGPRWVRRGWATVVLVARFGDDANQVTVAAVARRLGARRSPSLVVPDGHDGGLVVAAAARHREAALAAAQAECERAGLRLTAVGTATLGPEELRLLPAVERARFASRIVELVPELGGCADVTELGPWAVVDSISADADSLALLSPAAHVLTTSADPTQWETVEAYLDTGGSVRETCERLHVHRTTLYYRLEHLPDPVRAALADGASRSALHLCLKLIRYQSVDARPGRVPAPAGG